MEWIVKEHKKHIKHMYSNKTEEHIYERSASIPGISVIASNFDHCIGKIVRYQKHKKPSQTSDVCKIADDLDRRRNFWSKISCDKKFVMIITSFYTNIYFLALHQYC